MSVREDSSILESWNKHDPSGGSRRMGSSARSGIRYSAGSEDSPREISPSRVIDKIRSLEAGKSEHYEHELPLLPIPGMGKLRPTCGNPVPRGCSGCGKTHYVGRTCKRSMCPRCWKSWARRRATTIASKLEALRIVRESAGPGWRGWKFHHVVLSPPEGYAMNREDPLEATFEVCKEILAEIGADTGALIYHPLRGPDHDDRGFWAPILPDGEEMEYSQFIEDHDLNHSPHFHAIVLSKFIDTANVVGAVEEKTGWVIHRITKGGDSDISLFDDWDLASSLTYCLSHGGIGEDQAAYRYFGEVANFTAWEGLQRSMDAKVRACATNTLGIPASSTMCTIEREKKQTRTAYVLATEEVNLGAAHGGGGGEPELEEIEEEVTIVEECNGRLVDVRAFPRYLNDPDWVAQAPHAQEMARAWHYEWEDREDAPYAEDWDRPPDTEG